VLSDQESKVIHAALRASVEGPFFPDWEFQTLMGVDREEMRAAMGIWPERTDGVDTELSVNNALVMLLGYPHGRWDAWPEYSEADRAELFRVYERWRSEQGLDPSRGTAWDLQ
jgi:hypothetical protein